MKEQTQFKTCGQSPSSDLAEMNHFWSPDTWEGLGRDEDFNDPLTTPLCPNPMMAINTPWSAEFGASQWGVLDDFPHAAEHLSPSPAPGEGHGTGPLHGTVLDPPGSNQETFSMSFIA